MRCVLLDRGDDALERRLAAKWAAAGVDVLPELGAELVDVARDRHGGRVAERAEALAEDAVADVQQQVELALLGLRVAQFYMHESCGKCTPCREGTRWMVQILHAI